MTYFSLSASIQPPVFLRADVLALLIGACLWLLVGCSRGPTAIQVPDVDPNLAAKEAIELYDTDDDGTLSGTELTACPGILGHLKSYDTDGNGSVSQQEIEAQISQLRSSRVGITSLGVRVQLDGRPLKGAQVKLIPEKFLGEEVKVAWGTSNARGIAAMDIRDVDVPASEHGLRGVHYGTYKVEVTHPDVPILAKYNTQTTLGYETEKGNPSFLVNLKSR